MKIWDSWSRDLLNGYDIINHRSKLLKIRSSGLWRPITLSDFLCFQKILPSGSFKKLFRGFLGFAVILKTRYQWRKDFKNEDDTINHTPKLTKNWVFRSLITLSCFLCFQKIFPYCSFKKSDNIYGNISSKFHTRKLSNKIFLWGTFI